MPTTGRGGITRLPAGKCRGQRGATVLSTLLLVIAMSTVGLLAMRNTTREVVQSGRIVSRERALLSAQAAASLAASRLADTYGSSGGTPGVPGSAPALDQILAGQGTAVGCTPCGDCIPGVSYGRAATETGQRNHLLAGGAAVDCGGRPCMRQGAVLFAPGADPATPMQWCQAPARDIVEAGDPESRVSVWVRNNASDALAAGRGSGSWTVDGDGRVTITASAEVRGTRVTVEKEVLLGGGGGSQAWRPQSADSGYGGGHNNDNTAATRCTSRSVGPG